MNSSKDYNVVFEGTGKPGSNYEGMRTITSFDSEAQFEEWWKEYGEDRDIVVVKGVSFSEAQRIAKQSSGKNRVRMLKQQHAQNPNLFNLRVTNALFALFADDPDGSLHDEFFEELFNEDD